MTNEGNISVSPKVSFALGLVGGVLVLCTIGFFVLLGLVFNGNAEVGPGASAQENNQPSAAVPSDNVNDGGQDQVGEITPVGADDHIFGSADSPVTVFVYSDFECPYCGRFHSSLKQLMDDYEDDILIVFRNYPLSFHANARPAANAAECAGEQGKFWEFADGLFEDQTLLGANRYEELATGLGIDLNQFKNCVSDKKYDKKISTDLSGGVAAGVQGTPGTIIVGADGQPTLVPGAIPYDQLKVMVEAVL